MDNQSIKESHAKTRGYDAGKKICGWKRHIAMESIMLRRNAYP